MLHLLRNLPKKYRFYNRNIRLFFILWNIVQLLCITSAFILEYVEEMLVSSTYWELLRNIEELMPHYTVCS